MTTDPYVTTHFFQALTLNSPWCSLLHDGGGMTRTDVSTPPAAPATLGDGFDRTGIPGCGSAGHPLARIAQLRHGCCPPPALLTPLACGCCKPPLNRASQQLPQLSCSRRRAPPPCSASSAPHRAVTHLFAGRLKDPIASSAGHAHERAERRSNASGPSVCMNNRPRARWSDRICACQRSPAQIEGLRKGAAAVFKFVLNLKMLCTKLAKTTQLRTQHLYRCCSSLSRT